MSIFLLFSIIGCAKEATVTETFEDGYKVYYKMSDDTWQCDGYTYQYRLEINGRMNNADKDATFVYLSNMESISYEQAWKAAGLSSSSDDYFSPKDAVFVNLQ